MKIELQLPSDKKCLLIWDAFNGKGIPRIQLRLAEEVDVIAVIVPKNDTPITDS